MPLKSGYIQVYTGNGKGKTTAAIGLAVRALGSGLKALFVQFMKNYPYGEVRILQKLHEDLVLKRYGDDDFVFKKQAPSKKLLAHMHKGLEDARQAMLSNAFDLIILDEILVSIYFKLFTTEEILDFMRQKPPRVELVLTGRYCPPEIQSAADLVTEMKEIRHYYSKGIAARKGIES
jgi:cob(I)alamin adenosyltransferase